MRTGIFALLALAISVSCIIEPKTTTGLTTVIPTSAKETKTKIQSTAKPPFILPTRLPGFVALSPTPDLPRNLPPMRTQAESYVVQPGDSLARIASRFGIGLSTVVKANAIENPDLISVGQQLVIPAPDPIGEAPAFKILPDSEVVNSPSATILDIDAFVQAQKGYLSTYREDVSGEELSGAQIVRRVSDEFSVNPRILLALLEYQSNWLTSAHPESSTLDYPLNFIVSYRQGLYRQLIWAANTLNRGYYLWRVNAIGYWILADDSIVRASPRVNAGTAAVHGLFADLYPPSDWTIAVGNNGFSKTYKNLFGAPFDYTVEPIVPGDLKQPIFQLPFEPATSWSFTGGPHGGWGDGSAWAAIDFAPPGDALGCVSNDAWVTAVADGLVARSKDGVVVLDLDQDGFEQTGWTVLYLHIETRDRVQVGKKVKAGDRLGHASCEGGVSSGTHVHLARRYNGEWIPADGLLPIILDGWVSKGTGVEYDGFLVKNASVVEAWEGRKPENQIHR